MDFTDAQTPDPGHLFFFLSRVFSAPSHVLGTQQQLEIALALPSQVSQSTEAETSPDSAKPEWAQL